MIEQFIAHLNSYSAISEAAKDYLRTQLPVRKYPRGAALLEAGQVSTEFFFLLQGATRLYYMVEGEERTAFFYTENQFVSSYESWTKQLPAKHFLEAIEDTQAVVISQQTAFDLLQRFPRFEFLARMIMEEELITYQEIISTFITLNPEQRYLHLMETQPALLRRIPQRHLATYIGVAPESLSRIRKRIREKGIS